MVVTLIAEEKPQHQHANSGVSWILQVLEDVFQANAWYAWHQALTWSPQQVPKYSMYQKPLIRGGATGPVLKHRSGATSKLLSKCTRATSEWQAQHDCAQRYEQPCYRHEQQVAFAFYVMPCEPSQRHILHEL